MTTLLIIAGVTYAHDGTTWRGEGGRPISSNAMMSRVADAYNFVYYHPRFTCAHPHAERFRLEINKFERTRSDPEGLFHWNPNRVWNHEIGFTYHERRGIETCASVLISKPWNTLGLTGNDVIAYSDVGYVHLCAPWFDDFRLRLRASHWREKENRTTVTDIVAGHTQLPRAVAKLIPAYMPDWCLTFDDFCKSRFMMRKGLPYQKYQNIFNHNQAISRASDGCLRITTTCLFK